MMYTLFTEILNRGIGVSWLVLVIVFLRFLLRKAPKWTSCLLWALAAVYLICPRVVSSSFSVYSGSGHAISDAGTVEYISCDASDAGPRVSVALPVRTDVKETGAKGGSAESTAAVSRAGMAAVPLMGVWLAGICALALYGFAGYLRLRKTVGVSVRVRDNQWVCDGIASPFILGLVRPRIYLPSGMSGQDYRYVLAHENAHLHRKDHWWKMLGAVLLTVYWFSPLLWLAFVLLGRDIEVACDEYVVRNMGRADKSAYSQALLNCSDPGRRFAVSLLAFGEVGVKARVKAVLRDKKPALWLALIALLACGAVAVGFLTRPEEKAVQETGTEPAVSESGPQQKAEENGALTVQAPVLQLSDSCGSDGARIYYADKDTLIFGGCFGLFVYDTGSHQITRSLDLEPIGCNFTQGEDACEISVSADGGKVYLHPARMEGHYVYDVKQNTLKIQENTADETALYTGCEADYMSASYEQAGKTRYVSLVYAWTTIGQLGYKTENENGFPVVRQFFVEDALRNLPEWNIADIHDLVKAEMYIDGQQYVCTDRDILRAFEESAANVSEVIGGSGCPFYDALYLTREDGSAGFIYPATDSCQILLTKDGYYELSGASSTTLPEVLQSIPDQALIEEAYSTAAGCALTNRKEIKKNNVTIVRESSAHINVIFPTTDGKSQVRVRLDIRGNEIYSSSTLLEEVDN